LIQNKKVSQSANFAPHFILHGGNFFNFVAPLSPRHTLTVEAERESGKATKVEMSGWQSFYNSLLSTLLSFFHFKSHLSRFNLN
jgi:hypothetical protein